MSYSLFPSRQKLKFGFGVTLSDRQLWAIGLVSAEWSMLEFFMLCFGQALTADDQKAKDDFTETLVFRHRLRKLRRLVEEKIIEPWQSDLLGILSRIGETAQERDRIIHGIWGGPPIGVPAPKPGEGEARKVIGLSPRRFFEWKLTYAGIIGVVAKIDAINVTMVEFQIKANGNPNFTTESALQRISRKPNPNP